MSTLTLYIGNKNFSSWSMRAWLAMKATGADFKEVMIRLREPQSKQQLLKISPVGQVPALQTGHQVVWDSLAIGETLAEMFPDAGLWPTDVNARAHARSICAEMHSGFTPLRSQCQVDMKARITQELSPEVLAAVARIEQIWQSAFAHAGRAQGPYLYGTYSLADIFYAPVVSRFVTYSIPVSDASRRYMELMWNHPDFAAWYAAALQEA